MDLIFHPDDPDYWFAVALQDWIDGKADTRRVEAAVSMAAFQPVWAWRPGTEPRREHILFWRNHPEELTAMLSRTIDHQAKRQAPERVQ